MSFFTLPEPAPEPEPVEDPTAPWIVARSDHAAVVISRLRAYPVGVEMAVVGCLRGSEAVRAHGAHRHLGRGWPSFGTGPLPDEHLRIGVAWPDGGRATNIDGPGPVLADRTEPTHGLDGGAVSSSGSVTSFEFWLWPVPTSGHLEVVVEWPAFGVLETRSVLDGDLLRAAAGRARPVWEGDPRPPRMSRQARWRHHQERHGASGD